MDEYFEIEQPLLLPLPQEPFETGRLFTPRADRYSQITVSTNRHSVPTRLIGERVRVVLRASDMVACEKNVEVARHERLIAKGSCRLDLDHYLEALIRKPGAFPGATALEQAHGPRPARPREQPVSDAHHEILARAVRALDGTWDTSRAMTVLRDVGVTAAGEQAAQKQARKALRRLREDGLLATVQSPGNTAVYRRA